MTWTPIIFEPGNHKDDSPLKAQGSQGSFIDADKIRFVNGMPETIYGWEKVGNILKAQATCGGARFWVAIQACLPGVTGPENARETKTYVDRIDRWWREMELLP